MKIYQFSLSSFLIIAGILPGCKQETKKPPLEKPPLVTVAKAGIEDTYQIVTYSGSIVPDNITDISFAVSGTINKVAVNEGQELESQISLEVEQASLDLQLLAKKVKLMEASLVEADQNLKLSNDRFEAGIITGEDVLIAETMWQKAYSEMLETKIRYQIAEANFRKATAQIK